jgi:hypothetical protein
MERSVVVCRFTALRLLYAAQLQQLISANVCALKPVVL